MTNLKKFKVLIVEDDPYYNKILTKYVQMVCNQHDYPDLDFEIRAFRSAKEGLAHLDSETDILVLDYFLEAYDDFPYNGFDLIKQVNRQCKGCKVIVISGQRNVTVTTELFKHGIFDYVDKDYMPAKRLASAIQRILNGETKVAA